jgi:hypothetical protein
MRKNFSNCPERCRDYGSSASERLQHRQRHRGTSARVINWEEIDIRRAIYRCEIGDVTAHDCNACLAQFLRESIVWRGRRARNEQARVAAPRQISKSADVALALHVTNMKDTSAAALGPQWGIGTTWCIEAPFVNAQPYGDHCPSAVAQSRGQRVGKDDIHNAVRKPRDLRGVCLENHLRDRSLGNPRQECAFYRARTR